MAVDTTRLQEAEAEQAKQKGPQKDPVTGQFLRRDGSANPTPRKPGRRPGPQKTAKTSTPVSGEVPVVDVSPVPAPIMPDSKPAKERAKDRTPNQRKSSLQQSFQGFWSMVAAVYDDPALELPDKEAEAWADPVFRTLEQYSLDHHIEKLAPMEAAVATAEIAIPRTKRILLRTGQRAQGAAKPPAFVRPGSSAPAPESSTGAFSFPSTPPVGPAMEPAGGEPPPPFPRDVHPAPDDIASNGGGHGPIDLTDPTL